MRNLKRTLSLSVCAVLLAAHPAAADFLGMEVDTKDEIKACTPAGGLGLDLMVCNFYAAFDNRGDRLSNIGNPAVVTTTDPNGYFQHMFGQDIAPNCALFLFFPCPHIA